MRRRILAIVSAAVIAVLLLTGCSNGFKQASLVNVAKKNDLKQLTLTELEKFFDGESYSVGEPYENKFINSGYYVAKDSEEATYALKKHYRQDANDSIGLKDLALCGKDDVFFGIVMTAESEENANNLYFEWLDIMASYDGESTSGTKNGYKYKTGHNESISRMYRTNYFGVYTKGKTVLAVAYAVDSEEDRKNMEVFFKQFGVIPPESAI